MTIDTDARVPPRGWLTLAEAAEVLGMSAHSVRRKARAGQLVARQVPTDRGPAWRVLLHPDGPVGHPDTHGAHRAVQGDATVVATVTPHAPPSAAHPDATLDGYPDATVIGQGGTLALAELVALLRSREARIDELAEQLIARTEAATVWQARAEMLADRLAAAESKMAALTAPESPLEVSGSTEAPEPTTEAPGPWYRRWRAWLAAVLVVAVVGSVSCQASGTVKHAGLCTSARATMDFMATLTASGQMISNDWWSVIRDATGTAEKVC